MIQYLHRFKGTLIAFVIFIVLLGAVFLFDREEKTDKRTDKRTEKVFPDIKPEEIVSIRLTNPESRTLLEKDGGVWALVTDSGRYRADGDEVSRLIEDIVRMEVEKELPAGGEKLNEYGFVRSKTEFTVTTKYGDYPVIVGDKSPVGSGTYVYDLGDGRVMIVDDRYLEAVRNKRATDFRERKLLNLTANDVDRISINVGDFSIELRKENGGWTAPGVLAPEEVDQSVIIDLLNSFSELEASGFENDIPQELSGYGLVEPVAEIGFYQEGSGVEVLFGKRKDEKDYYLKIGSEDAVYSVSKDYFKLLPKNIDRLRGR